MAKSILLLTTPFRPNVGGVETHLDDLIREGVKRKIKFIVVTYQPLITKAKGKTLEKGDGYVVYRIPWIRMNLFLKLEKYPLLEFIYLFPGLFVFGFLFLIFNTSKIKTIHSQGLVAGAVGLFLGKIFNKKTIISTHSIYNFPKVGLYASFIRYMFNSCKVILCLSKQSRNEVVNLGISPEKVKVFTYWVNQKVFKSLSKEKARKELRLPLDKFICLFVGRLVGVKGINELLDAARITRKNIIFLIVGDGPLAEKIGDFSKRHANVLFYGKTENEKLPIYYNAVDILIIPSTHEEGFGRVILESLSCGTPVVGSDRGAIPEAINDKVGVLIKVTSKNIKRVLEKLSKDTRYIKRMSGNARKFALQHYSSKNVKGIIQYYE